MRSDDLPGNTWSHLHAWLPAVTPSAAAWGGLALSAAIITAWQLRRRRAPVNPPPQALTSGAMRGTVNLEDTLTLIAAAIATAVAGQGMWRVAGDILQLPVVLRSLVFCFLEIAVLASAVRARRSMREHGSAGADGTAVWVLTCLSAVLSSLDARSTPERIARLSAPLVAAWLWERGMAVEHRRSGGPARSINWRITPERVLIRLGLAEPTGRTASDVDAQRRLIRLAITAAKARPIQPEWRRRLALRRVERATRAAVEHAGLASDATRQAELLAHLAVLINAHDLTRVALPAPWSSPAATTAGQARHDSPHDQQPMPAPVSSAASGQLGPGPARSIRRRSPQRQGGTVQENVWHWYKQQREAGHQPTQGDIMRAFGTPRSTAGRWRRACEDTWIAHRRSGRAATGTEHHEGPALHQAALAPALLLDMPSSATG